MLYENYQAYKNAVSKEVNEFPMFFAFSNKQFEEGKIKLNIQDDSELSKIPGGGFIKKSDDKRFLDMLIKHELELRENIDADETGEGFIYTMFLYELNNHEYGYTYELDDTLDALGLDYMDIEESYNLSNGLLKAKNEILAEN